jgi:sulfur-carrier protein adenylyltransferase/sulfurtransferase
MAKSYKDLVAEAKTTITCTQPDELKARLDAGEKPVIVDVREPNEWAQGTLPGAHCVPRGVLELQVDSQLPRDTTVVLYCGGGGRSALAAKSLREMGFDHVENLEGGFGAWTQAGYPVESV